MRQRIRYRLTALTRNILIDIIVESYSMRERERERERDVNYFTASNMSERDRERGRAVAVVDNIDIVETRINIDTGKTTMPPYKGHFCYRNCALTYLELGTMYPLQF